MTHPQHLIELRLDGCYICVELLLGEGASERERGRARPGAGSPAGRGGQGSSLPGSCWRLHGTALKRWRVPWVCLIPAEWNVRALPLQNTGRYRYLMAHGNKSTVRLSGCLLLRSKTSLTLSLLHRDALLCQAWEDAGLELVGLSRVSGIDRIRREG